jgi:predicted MFS family arabinose efflux permease
MSNYEIKEASEPTGSLKQRIPILAAVALSIIAAGSYTTLAGLLTRNFVEQLDWSVSAISLGISINMVLYGVTAPFSIYLMGKYGVRKISTISLLILALGSVLCLVPNALIFNISWGILVGVGCGSLTMAYGALVARTWFNDSQGIVAGILTASAVFGQFALLPFWAKMIDYFGWQAPLLGCGILALLAALINFYVLSRHRLGSHESNFSSEISKPFSSVFTILLSVMGERAFWTLVILFLVCGATTNGLLWSHFILACGDAGINATMASTVLLMVGVFNVVGTVFSGWLCDRISPRVILVFVFIGRALTLFWLPLILTNEFDPRLVTFGIVFGILDVATVPPIIALCNRVFGQDGPSVFGWINAFHQVGAGGMALVGGLMRANFGSYTSMWVLAGGLCVLAAFLVFTSSYRANPQFSSRTELA